MSATLAAAEMIDLGVLDCSLDNGIATRAAIGLIVLATDQTMEREFHALLRLDGVAIYESRLFNDAEITPATLRAIGPRIGPAAALILPGLPLNVVAFGCTSATMELGEEAVFAAIRESRPGIACTTPVTAAFAAFRALGARRIGVLTPYAPDVNARVRAGLERGGVEVAAFGTFDKRDDRDAARISANSIADAAIAMASRVALDAVFVSCTSLRVAEVVTEIEDRAGIPVTSSNHAIAWHALRLAGVADRLPEAGRLFATALA